MISNSDLTPIGKVLKTHGIKGELNCLFDSDVLPEDISYAIIETEGINVPFFIDRSRPRHADSYLVKFDGIDDENGATLLVGKTLSILKSDFHDMVQDEDEDGRIYVSDLIGFMIRDKNIEIGEIVDIEDRTENVLFVIKTSKGDRIYVPAADDLIDEVDTEGKTIYMNLPVGLVEIQ